ncbi:hypothetical protein EJG51_016840 [Undibacterium piscinae]|uniref:Uncharacterized protein n=1 Tax=Undibacterium piscinae TaxID=2495591 RepID=A0A6M4ABN4_9BURK|nr:hypothetical protein EJG51_016840 [Undibacterium piscinae]
MLPTFCYVIRLVPSISIEEISRMFKPDLCNTSHSSHIYSDIWHQLDSGTKES